MVNIVEQANEQASIIKVCHLIGMDEVTGEGRATKYHCPFAEFYHSKPNEKAFRVYPETNSAFCFGGCGYFSPVSLYARANDFVGDGDKLRMRDAAKELMKTIGYEEPDLHTWQAISNPKPPPINQDALRLALQRLRDRLVRQAGEKYGPAADDILRRLEGLLPQVRSQDQIDGFMKVAEQAISIAVGIEESTNVTQC